MKKRPLSVTVIGCLFLAAGTIGVAYHATEFKLQRPIQYNLVWVLMVRLLAIVGAVFLLRAANWARWLLVIWLAFHVGLSAFHKLPELIMHGLVMAVIAYFLFRPPASTYFRNAKVESEPTGGDSVTR